jgi:hypothetical protein
MKNVELEAALRILAKRHPNVKDVGYMLKIPLNPKSRGIRWTPKDLKLFRQLQREYKK